MTDHLARIKRAEAEIGRFRVTAVRLDKPGRFSLRGDDVVPIASMFKVLLALEAAEAMVDGRLCRTDRIEVTPRTHSPGGIGLNQFAEPVLLSLHDLLYLSLAVSDNTASDLLLEMIGLDALHRRANTLGLITLTVTGGCRRLLADAGVDLGYSSDAEAEAADWAPRADADDLVLHRTTRASMDDLADLAALLAEDRAASADACQLVRGLMARQIWTTRLARTFTLPEWHLLSKTGTLSPWRGEVGVVTRSDGARVAVAIAVRQHHAGAPESFVDAGVASVAADAVSLALNGR
jgi:beta-lactamase class A